MMTQEQSFLKADVRFQEMIEFVRQADADGRRIDEVERELFGQLLALGLALLEAHVAKHGNGDEGSTIEHEGKTIRRLPDLHERSYASIFGELQLNRYVYGTREGQKIEWVPLDAWLGLPEGKFSCVLEDWFQRLCVKESFAEASASLQTLLGLKIDSRTAEHMNQKMAEHVERFCQQQDPPPAEEEAEILVATADGKGVPMRRKLEDRLRGKKRRGKGEKANKKQMAYVGAVYSIKRFPRTADEVIDELQRTARTPDRPVPEHQRVWAEMTRLHEGEPLSGRSLLFLQMAIDVQQRDPDRRKELVCLLDGEKPLWQMKGEWLGRAIGVLDFFHVSERLWATAYCFHAEGSEPAQEFVTHRLRMLLCGKVGYVIGGLRRSLKEHKLTGERRRTVLSTIRYYENNRQHMRYDEYLAAGYPIGSGVAEGACRHLVKDRMEQAGMRWCVAGAQSMLHLRSIHLNGEWDDFVNCRIESEQTSLYGQLAA